MARQRRPVVYVFSFFCPAPRTPRARQVDARASSLTMGVRRATPAWALAWAAPLAQAALEIDATDEYAILGVVGGLSAPPDVGGSDDAHSDVTRVVIFCERVAASSTAGRARWWSAAR